MDRVKNRKELSVFELWGVKRNNYKVKRRHAEKGDPYPIVRTKELKTQTTEEEKETYR